MKAGLTKGISILAKSTQRVLADNEMVLRGPSMSFAQTWQSISRVYILEIFGLSVSQIVLRLCLDGECEMCEKSGPVPRRWWAAGWWRFNTKRGRYKSNENQSDNNNH